MKNNGTKAMCWAYLLMRWEEGWYRNEANTSAELRAIFEDAWHDRDFLVKEQPLAATGASQGA